MGSYAQTIMKDQRLVLEEALVVAAPESVLTMPHSVAVGASAKVGDIIFHEFPAEAQQSIEQLVKTVETSQRAQIAAIPEMTKTIAQGQASIVPEMAKYLLIAVVVVVVVGKVWR